MNIRVYTIITLVLIGAIIAGSFFYLSRTTPITRPEEKNRVVVTIVPQAQFVEKVGGEKVMVTILVPPGASPHTHEPTPSEINEVAKADMYAKVGSPIEFELTWADKIISINPDMLIVDCSRGIQLLDTPSHEHGHVGKDPHIWLSPKNAIIMVENIYKGLIKIDPENEKFYYNNKEAYIKDLQELDKTLSDIFSGLSIKKFMVYHPTWGYLAHDYGLEMIPIEEEGKEPTPERLVHIIKQAKENNIKVIFANPEFQTDTVETVAKEIGGSVVLVSPLEKDYIVMLTKISREIEKSLN